VSSDGSRVAFLGRDRRPKILDADSGTVGLVLAVAAGRILDLAFSPDGRVLVAAAHDGTVQRWSADDGSALGTLGEPSADAISSIAFSPDGGGLLVAGNAPTRIWDSMTGRVVRELPNAATMFAAYSSDGRHLITAGGGGEDSPKILNAATGDVTTSIESSGVVFDSIAMSPDGSLVAGVDEYGRITIWDAATGGTLRLIKGPTEASLPEFARYAYGLDFSPDGKRLLATGPGYALIWNIELDQRSPAEVDALVAAKSPWRLVDGRLILRQP
jgi:WD40 repeat protein